MVALALCFEWAPEHGNLHGSVASRAHDLQGAIKKDMDNRCVGVSHWIFLEDRSPQLPLRSLQAPRVEGKVLPGIVCSETRCYSVNSKWLEAESKHE